MSQVVVVPVTQPSPLRGMLRAARYRLRSGYGVVKKRLRRPNLFALGTRERVGVAYVAPSEMTETERLFLYAFVRGVRPERVLEIGSRFGGSGSIMAAAMEDIGQGQIVGVDPAPQLTVPERAFFGRFQIVRKPSPDGLAEARGLAGGPFDLVLVDGLHIYDQAVKDIEGVVPLVREGSYILFHDAFHFGLSEAIREALDRHPHLQDCGYVCAKPAVKVGVLAYGGLRLLRVGPRLADPQPILQREYAAAQRPLPPRDAELRNHDKWYCKHVTPCPRCAREAATASK